MSEVSPVPVGGTLPAPGCRLPVSLEGYLLHRHPDTLSRHGSSAQSRHPPATGAEPEFLCHKQGDGRKGQIIARLSDPSGLRIHRPQGVPLQRLVLLARCISLHLRLRDMSCSHTLEKDPSGVSMHQMLGLFYHTSVRHAPCSHHPRGGCAPGGPLLRTRW